MPSGRTGRAVSRAPSGTQNREPSHLPSCHLNRGPNHSENRLRHRSQNHSANRTPYRPANHPENRPGSDPQGDSLHVSNRRRFRDLPPILAIDPHYTGLYNADNVSPVESDAQVCGNSARLFCTSGSPLPAILGSQPSPTGRPASLLSRSAKNHPIPSPSNRCGRYWR
jgi:hypothetical protein